MKVVVAIDSFKGSLSSIEAGTAVKNGILRAMKADVQVLPLADGGEGTKQALVYGLGGKLIEVEVEDPLCRLHKATYGYLESEKMAIIEMADAAGLPLLKDQEKDPLIATTYGVGQMILDAISRGCREFIVGIGGSATNDGGIGMLSALGYEFLDRQGGILRNGAQCLGEIETVRIEGVHPELKNCRFRVACDVNNPLCGEKGATYIYGPQKGVTEELKEQIDRAMHSYAQVTKSYMRNDFAQTDGAGAAGGLGFAFLSYLQARLEPGIDLVMETLKLEEIIKNADFVITGEGRLDEQTAMGKGPAGIAGYAKKHGVKVIALAGSVTEGAGQCNNVGIDAYFSILTTIVDLPTAMLKNVATYNLMTTSEQLFRLIEIIGN